MGNGGIVTIYPGKIRRGEERAVSLDRPRSQESVLVVYQ